MICCCRRGRCWVASVRGSAGSNCGDATPRARGPDRAAGHPHASVAERRCETAGHTPGLGAAGGAGGGSCVCRPRATTWCSTGQRLDGPGLTRYVTPAVYPVRMHCCDCCWLCMEFKRIWIETCGQESAAAQFAQKSLLLPASTVGVNSPSPFVVFTVGWAGDDSVSSCSCGNPFTAQGLLPGLSSLSTWRRHHCRACGQIFCDKCSGRSFPLIVQQQPGGGGSGMTQSARVCDGCYLNLTKRGGPQPASSGEAFLQRASTAPAAVRSV